MPRLPSTLALSGFLLLAACDNVGRAFDPDVNPPDTGDTPTVSDIEVPPARGDVREGRPTVRATYPEGGGWPSSVPIVVEFSESMNQASILPTTVNGTDGKVVLRPANTTAPVPVVYNFLAGGRLLVLRPLANLQSPQQASYDIVMLPGVRDADGVRFSGTAERVLSTFTVDPNASADGSILAVYPRDSRTEIVQTTTEFLCFFTREVNPASLGSSTPPTNFQVRQQGGAVVPGIPTYPLSVANFPEARCVAFAPQGGVPFAADATFEFVVNNQIRFANNGVLQFGGRSPYSYFRTGSVPDPLSVTVSNATPGFPHKVNRSNVGSLSLAVEVPDAAAIGDDVIARVYGGERATSSTGDLAFVQAATRLTVAGRQTAVVDFGGQLGNTSRLKFDEGRIHFTAQLYRGSAHSGIVLGSDLASQDTVQPTVLSIGPPAGANGRDLYAELETISLFGTASEPIGDASFAIESPTPLTAGLFASRTGGAFELAPLDLGRRSSPVNYSLGVKDLAGNESTTLVEGQIFQRGLVHGVVSVGGVLTVEVYDSATLRPVVGATVMVEPDEPVVPPQGRLTATTSAAGVASFTAPANRNTITVNAQGYDLVTLYRSTASLASLPLRPTNGELATTLLRATATLPGATAGTSVLLGSSVFDDGATSYIRSDAASPANLPLAAIMPNRPVLLTGFLGLFEPTGPPPFVSVYCNMLGANVQSPTPPTAPAGQGSDLTVSITLRDVGSGFGAFLPIPGINFASSAGLQTVNTPPVVRIAAAFDGFVGQVPVGVGFPETSGSNPLSVTANGAFSTAILAGLQPYAPTLYVVTEARDVANNFVRTRARISASNGTSTDSVLPQDLFRRIPPATSYTNPPLLEFQDAIDTGAVESTVNGVSVPGLVGLYEIQVSELVGKQRGRGWRILAEDVDAGVSPTPATVRFQLPAAEPAMTTLSAGTWEITAAARLFRPRSGATGSFVLGESIRGEMSYTRTQRVEITIP